MMKKRIVIVDDHASVRDMLVCVLRRDNMYDVVGEAGTGLQAMELCSRLHPDLVIVDLMLPELCGAEVLRRLRTELPETRTLVYTGTLNELMVAEAMRSRPNGFVEKSDTLAVLRDAMAAVLSGGSFFSQSAARYLHRSLPLKGAAGLLTGREREVLQLIAEGKTGKHISERMGVSMKTVENHRQNLMEKLGIHDVAGLTRYAVSKGMVESS
jgi:DNA-binding NarL/FixJ family response regulator